MCYVNTYIKERLLDVIVNSSIDPILISKQIKKEIPVIKKHDISYKDDIMIVYFWYYLDNEIVKSNITINLKKERREYKLSKIGI